MRDQLVCRSWIGWHQGEVSSITNLFSTSVWSMCLWSAYTSLLPPGGGFSLCQASHRLRLRIFSVALEEELKALDFCSTIIILSSFISEFSHFSD